MALPLTKAQQLTLQYEDALLDEAMRFDDRDLAHLAAEVVDALRAADSMTDRGLLYTLMHRVRRRQGRLGEALDAAKNAFRTDTTSATYANGVSAAYGEIGRHHDAIEYADRAERLLKRVPNLALGAAVALNQLAARLALGRPDVEEALARAAACAAANPIGTNLRIADMLAAVGRPDEALEFLARYLCASAGVGRGNASPIDVLRSAPPDAVARARTNAPMTAMIDAALDVGDRGVVGAADPFALALALAVPMEGTIGSDDHDEAGDVEPSESLTEEEIALAASASLRPDGSVDALAFAEALAIPMKGTVRSDDRAGPARR